MLSSLERLIRIRKVLGLSQRELAEEFQVSAGAVGSWEVGDREVPGPVLKLIELYENELFAKTLELDSNQNLAQDLTREVARAVGVTDQDLLMKLRDSFEQYSGNILGSSVLAQKVRKLALKKLVISLGETRGLPMKVAQIATFLDPRIPFEMRDVFESMQTRGKTMPYKTICQIFQNDFDRNPDEMFLEFSRLPVASASIGQVHKARLQDGTCVAVKIQHPDVHSKINENFKELDFVKQLSLFIGNHSPHVQTLIADLHQTVLQECDFEREADNQEKFRELFANEADVIIPKIFLSHSRKQVLTMEWIEGQNWSDFKKFGDSSAHSIAAKTISKFYAQSMFGPGLVHLDPHPGNYIFQNGKVAFIDFGRVKHFSPQTQAQLHQLHSLLMQGDRDGGRRFMQTTELFHLGPSFQFDRFWEVATRISQHLRADKSVPFSREVLVEHQAHLRELGESGAIHASCDFFWTILFSHSLLIAGRVDLGASGNWREILVRNMP